ncbi:hypothetical protein E2C01_010448 [Portunus trituberculatus]|uniref:Uncharacterized protein n=1 Tax=Portunus trituberculatus TaxID=210409 RepID=A0A5B7D8P0_PORTR|nr:hypothetical protein [Portunus trituberculatus]
MKINKNKDADHQNKVPIELAGDWPHIPLSTNQPAALTPTQNKNKWRHENYGGGRYSLFYDKFSQVQ